MKYKMKKRKREGGGFDYQYSGENKEGKKYTGKWYSTEQSARGDVNNNLRRSPQKMKAKKKKPVTGILESRGLGGRSPRMDKLVKKMMPQRKKYGLGAADVATMAHTISGGGSHAEWEKRYKRKPKPKVRGHETTTSSYGKASEVRSPTVKRKKI